MFGTSYEYYWRYCHYEYTDVGAYRKHQQQAWRRIDKSSSNKLYGYSSVVYCYWGDWGVGFLHFISVDVQVFVLSSCSYDGLWEVENCQYEYEYTDRTLSVL
eukprot:scaffold285960_cov19-Prasinocladus_malaysianus.AAC.1